MVYYIEWYLIKYLKFDLSFFFLWRRSVYVWWWFFFYRFVINYFRFVLMFFRWYCFYGFVINYFGFGLMFFRCGKRLRFNKIVFFIWYFGICFLILYFFFIILMEFYLIVGGFFYENVFFCYFFFNEVWVLGIWFLDVFWVEFWCFCY